jgi:hypothetical protein
VTKVVGAERNVGVVVRAGTLALILWVAGCGGSPGTRADSGAGGSAGGSGGGPAPSLQWTWLGAPLGAPVQAVALDGSGNVFAGLGVSGGVFRSTDDGASWQPSSFGMYGLTVGALAASGTTVYAGANNLIRSMDDGAAWQQLTTFAVSTISAKGNLVVVGDSSNGMLGVSSDGGDTFATSSVGSGATLDVEIVGSAILCATAAGIFRSVDGGATFAPVPGIYGGPLSADLHCDGVSTCYASAYDTNTGAHYPDLLKSVDAGATWNPLGMTNTRIVAVTATGIVYVSDGTSGQLIRSDDGGQTWTPGTWPTSLTCGFPFATQGDKVFAPCNDGVYRSDDEAATWNAASGSAATGAISGNASSVVVDTSPTALGTDGDIYMDAPGFMRSTDGGNNWQVLVPWAEPYDIPFDCFVTGLGALECLEDRGLLVRSTDHGQTWQTITVNPPAAPVTVAGSSSSAVYAGGSGGLARSDDDGMTFQILNGSPAATALQVLHDGHVLVQSTSGTYRSVDQGVTWQTLTFPPLPVLEDASGRLLYIELGGATRYSTDEGDSWTDDPLTTVPGLSGLPVVDGTGRLVLIFAPGLNQFTNLGQPPVTYTSTDGGATWTILRPPIPNPDVANFAVDKRGRLIAATAGGLYRLDTVSGGP